MVAFLQNVSMTYAFFWVLALVMTSLVISGLVKWVPIAGGSGILKCAVSSLAFIPASIGFVSS